MLVDVVKLWGSSSLEGEKRVGYLKYYGVAHQKLCNVSNEFSTVTYKQWSRGVPLFGGKEL